MGSGVVPESEEEEDTEPPQTFGPQDNVSRAHSFATHDTSRTTGTRSSELDFPVGIPSIRYWFCRSPKNVLALMLNRIQFLYAFRRRLLCAQVKPREIWKGKEHVFEYLSKSNTTQPDPQGRRSF